MRLVIEENDLINIKFIKWLVKRIKKLIILKCNSRKLSSIQNYVDNNNPFNARNKISINRIILQASQNIIFYKHKSYFYIMINPIIRAQGMDLKLEDICKFNYKTTANKIHEYNNGTFCIQCNKKLIDTYLHTEKEINEFRKIFQEFYKKIFRELRENSKIKKANRMANENEKNQ